MGIEPHIPKNMQNTKRIGLASDHAGYEVKEAIARHLRTQGYELLDCGAFSEERVDYPDFAHKLATAIEAGEVDCGIAVCGSGNGISMALNKHAGIRAALAWCDEITLLARQHNDANVLSLPGRFLSSEQACHMVDLFLATGFEGGRHSDRVAKIPIAPQLT